MVAGSHPPLGVIDTTQPALSAASTVVVPRHNLSIYSAKAFEGLLSPETVTSLFLRTALNELVLSCAGIAFPFLLFVVSANASLCFNKVANGFVLPSKG